EPWRNRSTIRFASYVFCRSCRPCSPSGLVLAGVGTYGTTSYSMAQRSHEFGARMALGARAQDVTRIVMQQGLKLTGVGFALGGMGMYALVKILISLLPPTIRP